MPVNWDNVGKPILTTLGVFVVVATLWATAFTVADNAGEQTIDLLREEKASLETRVTTLEGENKELQAALARAETQSRQKELLGEQSLPPAGSLKTTIEPGDTAEVYSGSLFITLVGTNLEYGPIRYQVTASIGVKGKESVRLEKVDPGARVTYGDYEVRVLSASSDRATFWVHRLQPVEP